MPDFTPIFRPWFVRLAKRTDNWGSESEHLQRRVLASLLTRAKDTEYGKRHDFAGILRSRDVASAYRTGVPEVEYEDIRKDVLYMIAGKENVLWPGLCLDFAQSSGTSGGRSKFIPVTEDSLKGNHYAGGADCVAHYLRLVPQSHLFAGKGFILGGSFSNTLPVQVPGVHVGDLSATLIRKINPLANIVRIPDKKTALMPDWEKKLPALVNAAKDADVTNISGVPSWFLTVIKEICKAKGTDRISEVWPNLEVFFHGGISFGPYRDEYRRLTDPAKMHFLETYNASEGFFAVQDSFTEKGMLLIVDRDVFYEFIPVEGDDRSPKFLWELTPGGIYEMMVSSSNGLWRYRLGDTVRVESVNPVRITVAGRTKSFINAFGEELMEYNADKAIAYACGKTGALIANYTAAPQFASAGRKGRHQWLIEWTSPPTDTVAFAQALDEELRRQNSDYDAKRSHSIFLDMPEIVTARQGLFDEWLRMAGNHKLGGQRKVPRLCNDRRIIDTMLKLQER